MKRKWITRLLFLMGFVLCCLPTALNIIEQRHQSDAVATYQAAAEKKKDKLSDELEKASAYNDMLYQSEGAVVDDMDTGILSDRSYQELLDVSGTGIMGSLDIPKINVNLPIYHGTEDEVLSNGIGHIQGTSLPVGGKNTHSVLTGHRGLPSSKLLVRLDELKEGDLFFIRVCDETLAYKVSEIQIVNPEDVSKLQLYPEEDLVSLVTCTPYGINTQRLIVTGVRIAYREAEHEGIKEAVPSAREIFITALPFLFLLAAAILYIRNRRRIDEDDKI